MTAVEIAAKLAAIPRQTCGDLTAEHVARGGS